MPDERMLKICGKMFRKLYANHILMAFEALHQS